MLFFIPSAPLSFTPSHAIVSPYKSSWLTPINLTPSLITPSKTKTRTRTKTIQTSQPPSAMILTKDPLPAVKPSPLPSTTPQLPSAPFPYPSPQNQSTTYAWDSVAHMWAALATAFPNVDAVIDPHCPAVLHKGDPPVRYTFGQMATMIGDVAAGLLTLGLKRADNVALFSENSHRWLVADQALMTMGACSAVRGSSAPVDELTYILDNSDSVALIVENQSLYQQLVAHLDESKIKFVVFLWGDVPQASNEKIQLVSLSQVQELGARADQKDKMPTATRDDVATLIYTSGTTGHPKGVMLTHRNLLHQIVNLSVGSRDPIPGNVFVNILPCWHVFERTIEYLALSKGVTMVYSNKRRFKEDLALYKPHILCAVPRLFEVLYEGVVTKIQASSQTKKQLFHVLSSLSGMYVRNRRLALGLAADIDSTDVLVKKLVGSIASLMLLPIHKTADVLVWKKIRDGVGGRLSMAMCGGGSLAPYLEDFFEMAGLEIMVGYGLTETSPVLANRIHEHNVRTSSGIPPKGTRIKIIDPETKQHVDIGQTGLIMAKGPQVTSGYYKNKKATEKAFDEDGYFNTGDLGWLGWQGDIFVTGRLKDVIVLSNGENIEPQPIEEKLLESNMIDQVMLVGQDKSSICALIVPRQSFLLETPLLSEELKSRIRAALQCGDTAALHECETEIHDQGAPLRALIKRELKDRNESRPNFTANDRIRDFEIVLEPFSVENGLLTQTLKMKRNVIAEKYSDRTEKMYRPKK